MTIEPAEFDMIALARRGLQALLDEAVAEKGHAARHAVFDGAGELVSESQEAFETAEAAYQGAWDRLCRFGLLYPERKDHPFYGPRRVRAEPDAHPFYGPDEP